MILHVTNGDSAGGTLKTLFPEDVVLPWRDVLHEGPAPAGLSLEELSKVRARFIAERGWAVYDDALADFRKRNRTLAQLWDEIVLWFEHDLYDQLQVIQVPDALRGRRGVTLIQPDDYLGPMPQEKLAALFPTRQPVTEARYEGASAAWAALRARPAGSLRVSSAGTVLRRIPVGGGRLQPHRALHPAYPRGGPPGSGDPL